MAVIKRSKCGKNMFDYITKVVSIEMIIYFTLFDVDH